MSTSSSKRRELGRADWFVGACLAAAVAMLWTSTHLTEMKKTGALATPASGALPDGGAEVTGYDPTEEAAAADDALARTAVSVPRGGPAPTFGGQGQSGAQA